MNTFWRYLHCYYMYDVSDVLVTILLYNYKGFCNYETTNMHKNTAMTLACTLQLMYGVCATVHYDVLLSLQYQHLPGL